jgi:hypothetical protein
VDQPRLGHPLPGAEHARINPAKLLRYVLDPDSPQGRHKAAVFEAVLGIRKRDWRYLSERILEGLLEHPVSSIQPAGAEKVATFGVRIPVKGLHGRDAVVITSWRIVDGRPELTSARVAKRRWQAKEGGSTL